MPDSEQSYTQSPSQYDFFDDPLHLSNSDQPLLQLVSTQFSGSNFLSWKRDVYLALVAKNKACFIDGTNKKPEKSDKTYHQWVRCDLHVMKWIQHSLEKKIRDSLGYVTSAKDLWNELLERYSQTNGLEIYQLKKDLSAIHQGLASLIEYYSSLKKTWENIDSLDPIPLCSCEALDLCNCSMLKRVVDRESNSKLIQFLMGLNSHYENVKTNILSMEPLPSINKALSLLQKIEKQRQICDAVEVLEEASAYASGRQPAELHSDAYSTESRDVRGSDWKKQKVEPLSNDIRCNYCHNLGHTKNNCFKLKDCGYCGRKGHSKEVCFKLKNDNAAKYDNGGRYGRGRGRATYNTGRNTYRRGANNADVLPQNRNTNNIDEYVELNDPLIGTGFGDSSHQKFDDNMMDGLVNTVMDKVLQAVSEKSAIVPSAANFAGPFK